MANKRKVMVLAGTVWQIPLIRRLQENDCKVLDVNLYEDSPAFAVADESAILNILDQEACLEYAKEKQIDAIMSEQCDIATPTVAYIAEQMKLPGIGTELASLYTNKFKMREFGIKHGIPTPKYAICHNKEEAIQFFHSLNRKMIIKPLDSNSSRGVYTIHDDKELEELFEKSLAYSHVQKAVLCERYIEGTEFTVDGLVTKKGHVSLAISKKHHYMHNCNIADELFFSNYSQEYDYEELRRVNDKFVDLSGLSFGLTHAEYKYEEGRFFLIEIGARGGGNLIGSTIVPLMSGVDTYQYLIDKSLGNQEKEIVLENSSKERCAVLKFFDAPSEGGVVQKIHGEDFLKINPKIVSYKFNFKVGDRIEPAKDDSSRIGFYIAYGDSEAELRQLMQQIEQSIAIEVK